MGRFGSSEGCSRRGISTLALLGLLALAVPRPSHSQSCGLSFGSPITLAVLGPGAVVTGDFNRDGKQDVLAAGILSSGIYFYAGLGSGSFGGTVQTPTAAPVGPFVTGDFDRNGILDVVLVLEGTPDTLAIMRGNGNGTFGAPEAFATGGNYVALAAGPFRDPSRLDVVASDQSGTGSLRLFAGNGDGTFAALPDILTGAPFGALAAGDFDRDANQDLLVAIGSTVVRLLGDGGSSFTQDPAGPVATTTGPTPGMVAADFTRDARLDVAILDPAAATPGVQILRDDGAGGYVSSLVTAFGAGSALVSGDFDADGRLDLAVSETTSGWIRPRLGDGAGGFPTGTALFNSVPASSLAVADFAGDGRLDLALSLPILDRLQARNSITGVKCAAPSFGPTGRMVRTPQPIFVARGDFDANGAVDLVVSHTDGSVSVLRGTGQGFVALPPSAIAAGHLLTGLATLDFDRDGNLDVAVGDQDSGEVHVLRGDGALGFTVLVTVPAGSQPGAVAAGDFDVDGNPDLAVANYLSGDLTIVRGDGSGGVASVDTIGGLDHPAAVAVGDWNGDGRPDLAVANELGGTVFIYRGNGDGTFALVTTLAGLGAPRALAAADFDKDGRLDLLVAESTGSRVARFLGNGDLTFGASLTAPAGTLPTHLAEGDFNGDGNPDVAAVNNLSLDVTVVPGSGTGGFLPSQTFLVGSGPFAAAALDYNRDGHLDLAVTNAGGNNVSLLAGNGDATFTAASALFTAAFPDNNLRKTVVADFDRDGFLDFVVTDQVADHLVFQKGQGGGTFVAQPPSPGFTSPNPIAAGDFDADGSLDVVVGEAGGVRFGRGTGIAFTAGDLLATPSTPTAIAPGDFNRDGNLDVAVANGTQVRVAFGNGSGSFSLPADHELSDPAEAVTVVDFDRDGIPDLVVAKNGTADHLALLRGDGTGDFNILGTTLATGDGPTAIAVADFNRDGFLDLAVANRGPDVDSVSTFLGNAGAGFFTGGLIVAVGRSPQAVVTGDFNADGKADFATANMLAQSVSVAFGRGNGEFDPAVDWGTYGNPWSLGAGDFDRDDKADLVAVAGLTQGGATLLMNTDCDARRLRNETEASVCNEAGSPFPTQPLVGVYDDGGNLARCVDPAASASIVAGTGTPGATLTHDPLSFSFGLATLTGAAIDLPGAGYRLRYAHGATGLTALGRLVNVSAPLAIVGPTEVCASDPATWDAGPGFETYAWQLDGAPVGSGQMVTLTLPAGPHTLRVDVTSNTCADFEEIVVTSHAGPLTSVVASVTGSTVVPSLAICPSCTGGTASAVLTGGGSVQWGWRATSGGPFNPIAGATSPSYVITNADLGLPGGSLGEYFLVAEATGCTGTLYSNEIRVLVWESDLGHLPLSVTVTSRDGEDVVQWVNPTNDPAPFGFSDMLVRYTTAPAASLCAFPADPDDGTQVALEPGVPGDKDSAVNSGLLDDGTVYCYAVFVHQGGGVFTSFPVTTITGRPVDTAASPVKWAYNAGAFSIVPPGNGNGRIHAVAQDTLHSMVKGAAGGTWPADWLPRSLAGPSQGRPSTLNLPAPVAGASRVIFLGSQGGFVYAMDADTGGVAWPSALPAPVPAPVQAAPSAWLSFFGGDPGVDRVLVGTRNGLGGLNSFYALDLADGSVAWSYDGNADSRKIGMIAGQATVDYVNRRVYFASVAFGAGLGETDTVWCLDLTDGSLVWAVSIPDVTGSPIVRNGRLYVGSYDGGPGGAQIHALDAATGDPVWGAATFDTGDGEGPVKLYVGADRLSPSGRLLFSTQNKIFALNDQPGSTAPPGVSDVVWVRNALADASPIPDPSTPAYLGGGPSLWVGSSDGHLYRLDYETGLTQEAIPLGEADAAVGSPTLDIREGFLYAGTEAGVVYAVQMN